MRQQQVYQLYNVFPPFQTLNCYGVQPCVQLNLNVAYASEC